MGKLWTPERTGIVLSGVPIFMEQLFLPFKMLQYMIVPILSNVCGQYSAVWRRMATAAGLRECPWVLKGLADIVDGEILFA